MLLVYIHSSTASGRPPQKTALPLLLLVNSLLRIVFTAPRRSNERDADHRKHRRSIDARFLFRGNVFTELLLSNELFRLLGVMSQDFCLLGASAM
jgi:hypothetical protein